MVRQAHHPKAPATIGLLYPGEMGVALAKILHSQGHRVITTLTGRSGRTRRFCQEADLELRESLAEVVAEADVLLSVVTPGSAVEVAESVRRSLDAERNQPLIYVDANSISPMTMSQIEQRFAGSGVEIVDVTIHGLASRLFEQGTIFASGPQAGVVKALFGDTLRFKLLGNTPGKASLHKMLLGSMSKGIIALFVQTGLVAQESGLLDEFLADLHSYYPDVSAFVERSLPTYPQHAHRRSEEMGEWESTLAALQFRTNLAGEIRQLFGRLAKSDLPLRIAHQEGKPKLSQLLEWMACDNPLRMEPPAIESLSL